MRLRTPHLADEVLLLAIDRELSLARQQDVDVHLARCAVCRARSLQLEEAAADLATVYRRDNERRRPSAGVTRAALQAKLRAESDRWEQSRRTRFASAFVATRQRVVALAVVAATVLLVGALYSFGYSPLPRTASIEADALPVAFLTPGATLNLSVDQICAEGSGGVRAIPAGMRQEVLRSYGMEDVPADEYELDYLITPQLGGATNARNLWPQRYGARTWNAYVKDQLEDLLPRMVCARELDLETAQRDIAVDWIAAYRKYFRTSDPLTRRTGTIADDDDRPLRLAALSIENNPILWRTSW